MSHDLNDYLNHIWSLEILRLTKKQERDEFILYSATIIDHIWWVRNELCHKEAHVSLEDLIQIVRRRFCELK